MPLRLNHANRTFHRHGSYRLPKEHARVAFYRRRLQSAVRTASDASRSAEGLTSLAVMVCSVQVRICARTTGAGSRKAGGHDDVENHRGRTGTPCNRLRNRLVFLLTQRGVMMKTLTGHLLCAVASASKRKLNCAYPCNPVRPAPENKHPHLPRNEDLPAPIVFAADVP